MKNLHISDLMVNLSLDELGIHLEHQPVSADRVIDILQARGVLHQSPARHKRRGSRLAVRLAIAAALALGLSVTAWAVYQAVLKDYLVETPTQLDTVIEDLGGETSPHTTLSLVGYLGTPEYEAYTEWEAWLAEHYGEHPMDNSSWHETPDNYYEFYGAAYQDQADALDQITGKYGVRLHESRAFADAEEIYALLGSEPFLSNEYENSTGYIYDDGTIKLDFIKYDGNVSGSNSIFVSVKGTITDISASINLTADYEEWSYQTASGPVVDLVLTPANSHIFFETELAYVHVGSVRMTPEAAVPHTRETLEALADSVDFAELAKVFGEGASFELTQAVETLDAAYWQDAQEREERLQRGLEEDYATSRQVIEELGIYGPDTLPDGYNLQPLYFFSNEEPSDINGWRKDDKQEYWDEDVFCDEAVAYYTSGSTEDSFSLYYTRYFTDASRTAGATAEQFKKARTYFSAYDGFLECQINGCPGFYYPPVTREDGITYDSGVMWLDEADDLMFKLGRGNGYSESAYEAEPFTEEELIAIAVTVTAE